MNNENLEKTLYRGKNEAETFFSNVDYASARNAVHQRLIRGKAKKAKPLWPFSVKAGFVAALMVSVAAVLLAVVLTVQGGGAQSMALSSQTVSLDKGDSDYLLNYFKVKEPKHSEPGLLSVLWELGGDDSEMVYSTVFDKCDEAYPASTIPFPDTSRNLVLIFSGDSGKDFIDYRLIGYNNNAVKVWWSQDYVPSGSIGVKDGVVVEQRDTGMDYYGVVVSHIVPYDVGNTGEVLLPVQSVRLRVGELILLVGSDSKMLRVSSQNGLFERMEQSGEVYGRDETLAYRAKAAGDDVLLLNGENMPESRLEVSVTE